MAVNIWKPSPGGRDMAKPKLMTYRQWQQTVKEQKERARLRRAEAKHAKLEAYWAVPAPSNYVELSASWLDGNLI
jgi:hypothetical protein